MGYIAIVDYGAGNLMSVHNTLDFLGYENKIAASADVIENAAGVILPGVGAFPDAMAALRHSGLTDAVLAAAKEKPFLGICLGMQLMCRHSEEGDVECLGIFDTPVNRFPSLPGIKVPHMGWNTLEQTRSPLFQGFGHEEYVYFVHSYYVPVNPYTIARTEYIQPFSAALHKDNFYATQFHPEKSGKTGERILTNFLNL